MGELTQGFYWVWNVRAKTWAPAELFGEEWFFPGSEESLRASEMETRGYRIGPRLEPPAIP